MLALLLTLATGQVIYPGGVQGSSDAVISPGVSPPALLFTAPAAGAYSSLTPTIGPTIACTRNSVATYEPDGGAGSRTTAAINTCRIEPSGLLIETSDSNKLANPSAPVTQTTASLATGSYTAWQDGTGSVTYSVGTIPDGGATGLPCTVSGNTTADDCHFTITASGTVVATVNTAPTDFQLEPIAYRTSFMPTGSRGGDKVSVTGSTTGQNWCVGGEFTPYQGRTWGTSTYVLFTAGTYGTAGNVNGIIASGYFQCNVYDSNGNVRTQRTDAVITDTKHRFSCCSCNGSTCPAAYVDSIPQTSALTGTGTGTVSGLLSPMTIGARQDGNFQINAYVSKFAVGTTNNENRLGIGTWNRDRIASVGDSITYGYAMGSRLANPWPGQLPVGLGAPWEDNNLGVSGDKTADIDGVIDAQVIGFRYSVVTYLGGINDLNAGATVVDTFATIEASVNKLVAAGMRVKLLTLLPYGSTSTIIANTQALNNDILNYCAGQANVVCVDTYPHFDDGTGHMLAAYDSGDGLHPNQAGADLIASLVEAAFP